MAKVGDVIDAGNARWRFSGNASTHFDAHVARSVPYYADCHALVAELSDFFLTPGTRCYDLGCSTGTLLGRLAERHGDRDVHFTGIDIEPDMLAIARDRYGALDALSFEQADIVHAEFPPADLAIAFYTLQFVPPRHRQDVFDRIYASLNWGGGLLLFEKVRAPDARFQDMMSAVYTDFKTGQGYTDDEILAKSRSLKGVLEPFSREGNLGLLERAGFTDVMTVFKYVCFEGFLAVK